MKHIIEAGEPGPGLPQKSSSQPGVSAGATPANVPVDEDSAGQRLDNFLLRQLKGVPKSHVYRIIRSGEVRVNKGRAAADTRLQQGDVVRLPPVRVSARVAEREQALAAVAPSAARVFELLHEDEELLALDKPAGVAVHGGSGVSFGVIEQLRAARPQARFLELVHRLDRDTSGILLVAKKRSALKALQDQFRERATGKTYLALVSGAWNPRLKVLDKPLFKYLDAAGERRVRVAAHDDPQGMKSVTLVRVRQQLKGWPGAETELPQTFSLLEVTIKTGRTHQIRVHLSSAGHPIVGDDKYGDFELNRRLMRAGLKRMFLHAWRLSATHPRSGEPLLLNAPLPPELLQWVPDAALATPTQDTHESSV